MDSIDRRRVAVGEAVRRNGSVVAARVRCGTPIGSWYCVSCGEDVREFHVPDAYAHDAPRALDWHCDNAGKPHVIAWLCPEHGPEVP